MKRLLAFKGAVYYPAGGMDDFRADYDSLPDAIDGVTAIAQKENVHNSDDLWLFSWAHIYDQQERRIVWTNSDS